MRVFVLWHEYGNEGGGHIERVYVDEKRAREDLALLVEGHHCKTYNGNWKLDELELTGPAWVRQ